MKDNSPPAFLFYPDDFSSDGKVEAMTTEEVGAYILLLCKAWREEPPGSIPNNDAVLARWARLTPEDWAVCKPGALAPFTLGTDNRWHQKRLRKEYEKLQTSKKRRTVAAKVAAEHRWNQQDNANGIRNASEAHTNGNASKMRKDAIPISSPFSSSSTHSQHMGNNGRARENGNAAVRVISESSPEKTGSRFSLSECERYAEHLKASGRGIVNPGGFATSIFRSGESDDLIEKFLDPQAAVVRDVSKCPDCRGSNFVHVDPADMDKGVKPCKHPQLESAAKTSAQSQSP